MENIGNNTLVYKYTLDNEYPPPMIQYSPVRWIAFVVSALFPLLAARVLAVARATRSPWLCAAGVAPLLLFIALVLRGATGQEDGDAFRMYQAQMVLHLCAGFVLVGMLLVFAAEWIEIERRAVVGVFLRHAGIGYTVAAALCTCVGFPLAFDEAEGRRISGYRLVSAALVLSIVMAVLSGTLAVYHVDERRHGGAAAAQRLAVIVLPAVLLAGWMAFALARMSLPMGNVANTSDALFYCLSVLPAMGVLIVWTGLGEEFLVAEANVADGIPAKECSCATRARTEPCGACSHEASLQRAMQKYA
ncbi:hypothetical protein H4S08_000549 [Coemansia sp. RSA 1365]|nr:hypothetical protein H4S08_000549 [Coemansia sp. RSA 1365]